MRIVDDGALFLPCSAAIPAGSGIHVRVDTVTDGESVVHFGSRAFIKRRLENFSRRHVLWANYGFAFCKIPVARFYYQAERHPYR